MIKFTIVTITYNAEMYINHTTESIIQQTYPYIEHIIIDGASTDRTLALEKDYMERSYSSGNSHEVKIICEPDNGLYDAMNKGLNEATGDYVCFINAGDRLHFADTIETIVANAELDDIVQAKLSLPAILYGDTDIVDGEGTFLFKRRLTPPEQLSWLSFRSGMRVCHQAFYVRTDIAKANPYNLEYKYSADIDWCIRVMQDAGKKGLLLKNIHATIADYMQEGTTTKHHKESLIERYRIMTRYYGKTTTILMHIWFIIRNIIK